MTDAVHTKQGSLSAFPIPLDDRPGAYPAETGLMKRELFAAMAMQGFLASGRGGLPQELANESIRVANALLYALSDEASK